MQPPAPLTVEDPAPAHAKSLAEQKADFTSEGAPPPGKVGPGDPVQSDPATFPEAHDDPSQAEELERQQDA